MRPRFHFAGPIKGFEWSLSLRAEQAAQLVEFAVALPLLVVFVVGIFDFSSAFTLKERLTNVARDAARASAADPVNDLSAGGSTPVSVADAFQLIDNYMTGNKINDCGIKNNPTNSGLTWTFTANGNGCPTAGLTIIVNRGYYYPPNGALPGVNCTSQAPPANVMAVVSTCVSIQYPYPWRFGRAASLLGRNTTLPAQISAIAIALNEN